jgi:hypothetical protein
MFRRVLALVVLGLSALPLTGAAGSPDLVVIRYQRPGYEFTVRRDGALRIRAAGPTDAGQVVEYRCATTVPVASSDERDASASRALAELFAIILSERFLNSEKEYLPVRGSFAYHGHDVRTTISVERADGAPMHRVIVSDRPAVPPPASVTTAAQAIEQVLRGTAWARFERECGTIPTIVIGID